MAETYNHRGSLQRAIPTYVANRPRKAHPSMINAMGTMAAARMVWEVRMVKYTGRIHPCPLNVVMPTQ